MKTFVYDKEDLQETSVGWSSEAKTKLTGFDQLLQKQWKIAELNGSINYSLDDSNCKLITGESNGLFYNCCATLNLNRISKRRAPYLFNSMNEPFNSDRFNFTKIKKEEILFEISSRLHHKGTNQHLKSYVIVNASPINNFHVLIVPQMMASQPQKLTVDALLLSLDILQLSSQPSFRVGFNSIHAWASVNHLHLHAMYCENELFIDDFPEGEHVAGSCYLITKHAPMPGFVFKIPLDDNERLKVCLEIDVLIEIFHAETIPYTVMCTRGNKEYSTRFFVWPRKSTKDAMASKLFNVACVEVGGLFPMRSAEEFETLTLENALETLAESKVEGALWESLVSKIKKDILTG